MRYAWSIVLTLTTSSVASTALAHEGHGSPAYRNSLLHYLLEPAHAAAWGALVLLVVGVLVVRARRSGGGTR